MEIWAVSKTTISGKDKKISKRFFNAKDEAIMYARSTVTYADLMGYEKIPGDSNDEVIIYQKGDKVIEYRVYHADGFEQTEDIKTSAYKYGDNVYLEVMHDFENKVAALYAYNPLMPESKVCLSKTDISKTNLSDQEILGFNIENLDERVSEIQKEIWNQQE